MRPHIKIYFSYFGYGEQDTILCEVCGRKAVDVHHIIPKGMGGSKTKDYIENLIALCRKCHDMAHNELFTKEDLRFIHHRRMHATTGAMGKKLK